MNIKVSNQRSTRKSGSGRSHRGEEYGAAIHAFAQHCRTNLPRLVCKPQAQLRCWWQFLEPPMFEPMLPPRRRPEQPMLNEARICVIRSWF